MADASESPTDTTTATAEPAGRPTRLTQVAAWVGIIAGIVFVVAVIFFSGFYAGAYRTGGYWHGTYRNSPSQPGTSCPMSPGPMGSGPMMGPGMMGPGQMGPGQMGPGGMPGPVPQTSAPASSATPHHP